MAAAYDLTWRDRCEEAAASSGVVAILAAAVAVTMVAFATIAVRVGSPGEPPPDAAVLAAAPVAASFAAPAGDPTRVRIPAISVNAPLVRLGVNRDGTLEVPDYDDAGWFTGGSRPGVAGPSVIAAHLDSTTGPAVFYRLQDLKPGDLVHIDYAQGMVTFVVREAESFTKTRFPTRQVYGPTASPELRLITCGGSFDRKTRSYSANLVVWADLVTPA